MFDLPTIAIIGATFLLAGSVKGLIGLGLPTVSLGILVAVLDLTTAMALMLVPSLVTNLWQAFSGGGALRLMARLWPFLLPAGGLVWLGAGALTSVDLDLLTALLGGLFVFYSVASLAGLRLTIPPAEERWQGALYGGVNGVLTGMTGSYAIPGVMYLQALGLPRDAFVQAMGMLFCISTIALGTALGRADLMGSELATASALAVAPAMAGMLLGQSLRKTLSEERFRRIFFLGILALGVYIMLVALLR